MSTIELKEKLIDKISNTNDENILAEINRLLNIDLETEIDDVYIFDENEKVEIESALNQIKKGDFFTHEQANKEINEWLGK